MNPRRLLMPLAFASSMGGMMTLISTPLNLVIANVLSEAGLGELPFFSFLPVGAIFIAVGVMLLWPLSKWFLTKKGDSADDNRSAGKSLKELVNEYGLGQNLFRIEVSPHSAVTVGASMCFASPFSTPPNALVMPAGRYTFIDYIKVGVPLQIIMGVVMIITLPLLFRF